MALAHLKPTNPSKGPTCRVCQELERLDAESPAEAAALRGHLADRRFTYTDLSDQLAADPDTPLDLPHFSLARHARGQCQAKERLRGA